MPEKSAEFFFLGRGFRPFFFLAALYSVLIVLQWVGFYMGFWSQPGNLDDAVLWHAHEMIYGFVMAVIAGFLLTAVANWTGGAPVRQFRLLFLCVLWLLGRLAMNIQGIPDWLGGLADNLFIPALAVSLALPLLRSWNKRNFIFLGLLAAIFSCNVGFFLTHEKVYLHAALIIILMIVALVGGRIIPAFTVAALRRKGMTVFQHDQQALDIACLFLMAVSALAWLLMDMQGVLSGSLFILVSILLLARLRHYHTLKTFDDPMLWILHAGYIWIVLGFFMLGMSCLGFGTPSAAFHALTVGGIGSMCIGMMPRVTLGHTGRELQSTRITTLSFILMQAAAIMRVGGPLLLPDFYTAWIAVSGVLWAFSFSFYLFRYGPMLFKQSLNMS